MKTLPTLDDNAVVCVSRQGGVAAIEKINNKKAALLYDEIDHNPLFRGNVVIVEGLVGLDQIRDEQVEFIALPLRVAGGDGSPVRAIAIETCEQ